MISSQILFLFSALGGVNGILLALYLSTRRSNRLANGLLAALLLAIGFRTLKATYYFFNPDIPYAFLQFGLSACLLIGPLTYLYVQSELASLDPAAPALRWQRHLLAPGIAICVGIVLSYARFPLVWHYAIKVIHLYWFCYLMLAALRLWHARAMLLAAAIRSSRRAVLTVSVFASSLLILVAYISTPFTSYIVGALSFTFSIHITVIFVIWRHEADLDVPGKEKYQGRKTSPEQGRLLVESLNRIMHDQSLYLNPALSLPMLAKKAGVLQTTVSQVINEHLQKTFTVYVNEFRIRHAITLLQEQPNLTMELVAQRSGFNSNSTFFAAFKKVTGNTPASYRAAGRLAPLASATPAPVPAKMTRTI